MKRHKMSLSVEYVSDWGVQEALRELAQNAIDWGNWSHIIDRDKGLVCFISHNATLEPASLLLGHSRKSEGSIGKFGEGFKLAMLVLVRLGYKARIITNGEIWTPKLIDSRTYKTKQLVFDVENNADVQSASLYFEVEGLSETAIDELYSHNLHLSATVPDFCTTRGNVIHDRPGDMFVNGLYVATLKGFQFGYDFKPKQLSLDRDRKLLRDFDIQYLTSQLWLECDDTELILEMIKAEKSDVKYVEYFMDNAKPSLADAAANAFLIEYSSDTIPVTSQADINRAKEQGHEKVQLMPLALQKLIQGSQYYTAPWPKIIKKTPREQLMDFRDFYKKDFIQQMGLWNDFEILITKAENWTE